MNPGSVNSWAHDLAASDPRPLTRRTLLLGIAVSALVGVPLTMIRAEEPQSETINNSRLPSESATAEPHMVKSESDRVRRVRELIYLLRQHRVFSRTDEWAAAIRKLVEIGKPAVPELIAELDRTERDETLRALGFTLRAIGDPRAVPALIRSIPKTLRPRGSDCGIHVRDPELQAFMLLHDRSTGPQDHFSYGRPVNEILDALQTITGHHEPPVGQRDGLRHVFLGGDENELARKRLLFKQRQEYWERWWSQNWPVFVTVEDLQSVERPRPGADLVEQAGLDRFGPLFPTGKDVRLGPVHDVELYSPTYWNAPSHIDFDTRRQYEQLEGVQRADPSGKGEVTSVFMTWCLRMGIDARSMGMIEGRDLHAWLVDDSRWDTLDEEVRRDQPLALGRETTNYLASFDKGRSDFKHDRLGTFLFTTREGGRGIVQVFPREAESEARRLRYRMWTDGTSKSPEPSVAAPRERATSTQPPEVVTVTLHAPGRGRRFLLNLANGRSISAPDPIVPAEAPEKLALHRDEEFIDWCRQQRIDIVTNLSSVDYTGKPPEGAPNRILQLIGLEMVERKILAESFDTIDVETIREILGRSPADERRLAWMSPPITGPKRPQTFIIKTRNGSLGVLQMVETGEDLQSIMIRYRLLPKRRSVEAPATGSKSRPRARNGDDRSR